MRPIVDVSYHNGVIDWDTARKHIDGAIIRVGFGNDKVQQDDSKAWENIKACERFNVPYGVYIYSYAKNEDMARSEARHVDRVLKICDANPTLGVFIDIEEKNYQLPIAGELARAFAAECRSLGHDKVGVYADKSTWNESSLRDLDASFLRWVAWWTGSTTIDPEPYLWQFSSAGKIPGIQTRVDVNRFYGERAERPSKSIDSLAISTINGVFGNGWKRKDALAELYDEVQARVNEYYQTADQVIAGNFGNGADRVARLFDAGYDFDTVQKIVNKKLSKRNFRK